MTRGRDTDGADSGRAKQPPGALTVLQCELLHAVAAGLRVLRANVAARAGETVPYRDSGVRRTLASRGARAWSRSRLHGAWALPKRCSAATLTVLPFGKNSERSARQYELPAAPEARRPPRCQAAGVVSAMHFAWWRA